MRVPGAHSHHDVRATVGVHSYIVGLEGIWTVIGTCAAGEEHWQRPKVSYPKQRWTNSAICRQQQVPLVGSVGE